MRLKSFKIMIFKVFSVAVLVIAVANAIHIVPTHNSLKDTGNYTSKGVHYWRDYNGTIPEDALIAGTDANGAAYVGQGILVSHGIWPGTLRSGVVSMDVQGYGYQTITEALKILCVPTNSRFRWLVVSCPQPTNVSRIVGGVDSNYEIPDGSGNLFLAKATIEGTVVVGYTQYTKCPALFAVDGKFYNIDDYFEILVHTEE